MLAKAVEWEMIERNPFEKGKSLHLKENNKRLRYLSEQEIEDLLAVCPVPESGVGLRDFILIAVNSGMRRSEILSLKWEQIRHDFIYLGKTKTDEPRQVPICKDLKRCLESIRQRQHIPSEYIFPNSKGGHLKSVRSSFRSALKAAKITNFRTHDLRHTFASYYVMRGGSLNALQKILGHKDIKMTMRYAHLSREFAREEIEIMNGLTTGVTKVSHFPSEKEKSTPIMPVTACNYSGVLEERNCPTTCMSLT